MSGVQVYAAYVTTREPKGMQPVAVEVPELGGAVMGWSYLLLEITGGVMMVGSSRFCRSSWTIGVEQIDKFDMQWSHVKFRRVVGKEFRKNYFWLEGKFLEFSDRLVLQPVVHCS